MRKILAVCAVVLAGCVSTPEANLFVACKSLSSAEQSIRPFVADMSMEQIAVVHEAMEVAVPICIQRVVAIDDPRAALTKVRTQLARLLKIQSEVTP